MFSITVYTKRAETLQPIKGFKGVGVFFSRKQTLEAAIGFKGFSLITSTQGGYACKITHYR
jgi:hypothetical protein